MHAMVLLLAIGHAEGQRQPPEMDFGRQPPEVDCDHCAKLTYAEGAKLSKKTDKPLVVWVGGEFCERCTHDSATEFVHVFVDRFDGVTAPATVVGVWEGEDLWRVGVADWWEVGHVTFGHLPTVRRALANWRANRSTFHQHAPAKASYGASYMMQSYQMQSYQVAPMRAPAKVSRAGGC